MNGVNVHILTRFKTGDWKVPGTRTLESVRYVAQAFQPAGSGDFPVACSCLQDAFENSAEILRRDANMKFQIAHFKSKIYVRGSLSCGGATRSA